MAETSCHHACPIHIVSFPLRRHRQGLECRMEMKTDVDWLQVACVCCSVRIPGRNQNMGGGTSANTGSTIQNPYCDVKKLYISSAPTILLRRHQKTAASEAK